MELQFLGAAGTVTGSKYLLTNKGQRILIDCGLFQGLKALRLKNWEKFPVNPAEISSILLTHAHIDHSGYIPRLVKEGFKGKIYCTPATKDLCAILLADSGHLMEEEAEYLNRKKKTKHEPALPLFTVRDAEDSMQYFETIPFNERKSLGTNFSFEFHYVGHILGASSIIFEADGRKVAFTGDIGRMNDKIFYPPEPLPQINYLVTESTYGNRLHNKTETLDELANAINETYKRNGVIIIPAFAVGRAQAILHDLSILKKQKIIPEFPMYLNSPMATNVGKIFHKYNKLHRLSEAECTETCDVVKYVQTVEESKALNERKGPMLIISASGMLTGGRILHHLKAFAPYSQNTILLTGYQAAGTRGEALVNGAEKIKIHGEYVPVKAQIKVLPNMSAHADYEEMIQWFSESKISPQKVFITHGESSAADEFRRRLNEKFGWTCAVPVQDEIARLE
ncbi:MBL fold metallo-hydrolase [Bdellovibrio sp. qaytius]|nr:MBL fold metallo-hydrolase [Bdellovibrio sp. qaytius]